MKKGSADLTATQAVLCWSNGTLNRGPCAGRSPEGVEVFILPVLESIQIPAGAFISYVTGHGEWNHLRGRENFHVIKFVLKDFK